MSGKRGRLSKLEAARREWERTHLPLSDVWGVLLEMFEIVEAEAGRDAAARIGGRMVAEKARRVGELQRGRA